MTLMEATKSSDQVRQQPVEPVYLESTLLRVFGVLFCHDPKRARSRAGKIEINRGVVEKGITVRFDQEYAQPTLRLQLNTSNKCRILCARPCSVMPALSLCFGFRAVMRR